MSKPAGSQPEHICVDASLILHKLLPFEQDEQIDAIWEQWRDRGVILSGPVLLYSEVSSVLRPRVSIGKLTPDEGEEIFALFTSLGVLRLDRDDLHIRAWELAKRYNRPRTYDMTYLALAELEDVEFWTGDERLVNATGGSDPRVHWIPARSSSTGP